MKTFKAGGQKFQTNDNWTGLWEEQNNGEFKQTLGTSQAFGEYEVRKEARKIAKRNAEFAELENL